MKTGIICCFNLAVTFAVTSACAAVQNQNTGFQPAGDSDFNDHPMQAYEHLAQVENDDFVVTTQDVERVQQALIKLGYYQGNVDGLAHRNTVIAIVELQTKEGLTITGEIDKQLLSFLGIR